MALLFGNRHGVLLVNFMQWRNHINAEAYCLTHRKLHRVIKQKQSKKTWHANKGNCPSS
jgi:hypothetical protein